MPRSENQKLKILYVAKYLMEYSDENHAVTAGGIVDYLKDDCGIIAERKSVYRDIAILRDVFEMDIVGGQGGKYRLVSRDFDFNDLRLLAECVHAAKFISKSKAKSLVQTISQFASSYEAEQLQDEVFLCDRVKTTRKGILENVSQINAAMAKKWDGKPRIPTKISFQYMKYQINDVHSQVERRKGAEYIVSPFKLLINEGNYYLLAYSDYAKDMRTYRVDRMKKVEVLSDPREGAEKFAEINMETYTQRVFSMFGGKEAQVRMRFINPLLDTVIERFGTDHNVSYQPDGDKHFIVSAKVEISDQFFGWICGFRKKASIIAPDDVVADMKRFLNDIYGRYETE
jgi:predicted DNA-binding transcriptional regulator YafY